VRTKTTGITLETRGDNEFKFIKRCFLRMGNGPLPRKHMVYGAHCHSCIRGIGRVPKKPTC
jgi:hypothetical protein